MANCVITTIIKKCYNYNKSLCGLDLNLAIGMVNKSMKGNMLVMSTLSSSWLETAMGDRKVTARGGLFVLARPVTKRNGAMITCLFSLWLIEIAVISTGNSSKESSRLSMFVIFITTFCFVSGAVPIFVTAIIHLATFVFGSIINFFYLSNCDRRLR